MAKVLAVLGATGQQGSSVVEYVINDQELSQKYAIRAVTRSVDSAKAQLLKEKVEVVQGDVSDQASLEKAFTGVHTLFAMTTPALGEDAIQIEYNIIKTIADVAVEKGVEYIIFSTLPSVTDISQGKYQGVTPFDAKAKGEEYIRGLPIKSSFYCPGSFMENFASQPFLAPQPDPDHNGTWVLSRNMPSESEMPLIDAIGDGGKFVGAILADPDKYQGKKICAATKLYTMEEMATVLSESTGKTVIYKQVSDEKFAQSLPPPVVTIFVDYFKYIGEFGYFGPGSKELVAWAAAQARGKLSTFQEYLKAHPYELA
ncbi:uncharacterized protein A1O9_06245 [Exophiala aquamarina CBS 119918]|uniref:NmrA-like domain-containing protein n=1 Tax=Exophiala aquamarina CBS 119918 TaxID=1182545 RepID=A0A072PE18_9EURO|nr:uncharacterized protein A1O9_06245 [Exophiala aquamarina CBS 119918]KEF58319.1 hypothetical protein A1O9_06245 [Exophiala aquamarina CBS 119918]